MTTFWHVVEQAVMAVLFIFTVLAVWAVGKDIFNYEGEQQ